MRAEFTVTNTTGSELSNVVLQARIPDGFSLFPLFTAGVTGGGTCSLCGSSDYVTWAIGTLAPGMGAFLPVFVVIHRKDTWDDPLSFRRGCQIKSYR